MYYGSNYIIYKLLQFRKTGLYKYIYIIYAVVVYRTFKDCYQLHFKINILQNQADQLLLQRLTNNK